MLGTLLREEGGLGSWYRRLGVSRGQALPAPLQGVRGDGGVPPRAPADLAPRGGPGGARWFRGHRSQCAWAGFGLDASGASFHQLSCIMPLWVRSRSYFPPLEEAQRRTGAEGGRWCPVDWLGKLRVSRSPFPAEMTRLAGAFLPPRPPLTPAGCT